MSNVIAPAEIHKCLSLENLPGEEWKDVTKYEGFYQISNMGRFKSLAKYVIGRGTKPYFMPEKILVQVVAKEYLCVCVCVNAKREFLRIHRLVGLHFVQNPENKPVINHKKGIKTDNRASELEWATISENTQHAYDTGLIKNNVRGERLHSAKLSENDVREIRKLLKINKSLHEIASLFNVGYANIYAIKERKSWRWLAD